MKKLTRLMAVVVAAALPMQAYAFDCDVKINQLLVYQDGTVNVNHTGRNGFTVLCNLNVSYKNVAPTTCAMWTAMLMGVKKRNATVNFYFGGEGSCAALPTYEAAPVPVYIGEPPGQ